MGTMEMTGFVRPPRSYEVVYADHYYEIQEGRVVRVDGKVDSVEMVEYEPNMFVNRKSGERLGIIRASTPFR